VAGRVRGRQRLGGGDPYRFAAQSRLEEITGSNQASPEKGNEVCILCLCERRQEKDRATREAHEQRLKKDLEKLKDANLKSEDHCADHWGTVALAVVSALN
jgi:hypothetical protein